MSDVTLSALRRATIQQLEAEKERLRARRAGQPLSVSGILVGGGTPGGFAGAPKPPSAARMLRDSAAEAVAAASYSVRPSPPPRLATCSKRSCLKREPCPQTHTPR